MPIEPLTTVSSTAYVIDTANIDTDVIFPARFLLIIDREGMGQYAFHDWRKRQDGSDNPDFPIPDLMSGERRILVAGPNFGCGSSREQAVWTLADLGIRCVIAPSFGEIFFSNCFKNGVLPVALPSDDDWRTVRNAARAGGEITVDLSKQTVQPADCAAIGFDVPSFRRDALMNGWDEIDMVLAQDGDDIRAFESARRAKAPWLFKSLEPETKAG